MVSANRLLSDEAKRPTILIVEDEVLVRLTISDQLRASGFSVIEASNADEAWGVLRTSTPVDLLLTDIQMPGSMDGLRLAELARRTWPEMRIILVSGQARKSCDEVADAFVAKPYDADDLVQQIRQRLAVTPE